MRILQSNITSTKELQDDIISMNPSCVGRVIAVGTMFPWSPSNNPFSLALEKCDMYPYLCIKALFGESSFKKCYQSSEIILRLIHAFLWDLFKADAPCLKMTLMSASHLRRCHC